MKIMYLSSAAIPSRTANSVHIMKMCAAFADNGHEVVLVSAARRDAIEAGVGNVFGYYGVRPGFRMCTMPWPAVFGRSYLNAGAAAWRTLRERPDLVYARSVQMAFFATRLRFPVILESHAPAISAGGLTAWMFRALADSQRLLRLVVISRALQSYYEQAIPALRSRVRVAPDAADPCETSEKHSYGVGDRLQVGYIGHLYRGRGIGLIVELARRAAWADFHIVGGVDSDIRLWKERAAGIPNVTFHGFLPPALTSEVRLGMDVLLAPYEKAVAVHGGTGDTSEWMSPLKVFEYMAAGKPILCSDVPVLREVLEHGRTALLIPYDDTSAWLQALEQLSRNQQLRCHLGDNARVEFLQRYTWQRRAETVLAGCVPQHAPAGVGW